MCADHDGSTDDNPTVARPLHSAPERYSLSGDPLAPRGAAPLPAPQQQSAVPPAPQPEEHLVAQPARWAGPAGSPDLPVSTGYLSSHAPLNRSGAINVSGRIFVPAGFGPRLRAFLIDFAVLACLGLILLALVDLPQPDPAETLRLSLQQFNQMMSGSLPSPHLIAELDRLQAPQRFAGWLNVALCAAYFVLFHGLAGTTPGKAAGGLRLLRRDGSPLGIGRAALRYLCYLGLAKLAYGTFVMPFDTERRTLHDMACGSNVFRELRLR